MCVVIAQLPPSRKQSNYKNADRGASKSMFCPKISVVLPIYNRVDLIRRSIDSILEQTYPAHEIIVVDDASTDGSPDAAESIVDERIRVIRCKQNRGGAVARNVGIDAAQGDFIAFLDSDDTWLPDKLMQQVKLLDAAGEKERVICYTNLEIITEGSRKIWNKKLYDNRGNISDYLISDCQAMQTSTLLMSSVIAREIRFNERLRNHQDWDFIFRAKSAGAKFLGTLSVLVHYENSFKVERISSKKGTSDSLFWLEQATPMMTEKALATFFAGVLFPRMETDQATAAWLGLAKATFSGRVHFDLIARVAMERLLSGSALNTLRATKRRFLPGKAISSEK
jgi:glycosyltransferase involved in cell wall biosynthesis